MEMISKHKDLEAICTRLDVCSEIRVQTRLRFVWEKKTLRQGWRAISSNYTEF